MASGNTLLTWTPQCNEPPATIAAADLEEDSTDWIWGAWATGLITNKPAEIIYSDEQRNAYGTLRDALTRLRRGESIQCDFSNGQFLKPCQLWSEDRDVRTNAEVEGDTRDAGLPKLAAPPAAPEQTSVQDPLLVRFSAALNDEKLAKRLVKLQQEFPQATLPELVAYNWLKREQLQFHFQAELFGGRRTRGGLLPDFVVIAGSRRLAFQAQRIVKLSDDLAQVKLQIDTQDAQRLLFERTLKDALSEAVTTIRNDLSALKTQTVRLPRTRSAVFIMAWFFLFAPVPLYYQEVRTMSGFHWTGSLVVVVLAYVCSAGLFGYLFGLFDNQVD